MTEIEKLQQQLQKQEKLASLGMLIAGIAHEIQNPLNFVINFSKLSDRLLNDLTSIFNPVGGTGGAANQLSENDRENLCDIVDNLKESMGQIAESGERAISIIRSILLISRGKENERVPADVCNIVKEYVALSYHAMRANHHGFNVTLHEQYQEGMPPVIVIPQDLSRAVLNVMNNACYAVWNKQTTTDDYSPEISVSAKIEPAGEDHASDCLVICIADNGEGMTDEVKQHLFENFYTTKPIGEGTGLGMGIIRDIIENKHGGKVTFTSVKGEGTTFTFTIPVERPSA